MKIMGAVIAGAIGAITVTPAIADGYDRQFKYSTAQNADGVDWTGLYSGLHTGGVSGKTTFVRQAGTNTNTGVAGLGAIIVPGSPPSCSFNCVGPTYALGWVNGYRGAETGVNRTVDIDGFHFGPHIGYQKQFGKMVYGADIGFSLGGGEGKKDCGNATSVAAGGTVLCESEYKYSLNLRGRVGYATGNYLFYGTAGLVRARIENSVTYRLGADSLVERGFANPNGYLVGLGVEYQAANGMRFGLGYTHMFLEDVNVRLGDSFGGGSGTRTTPDPDVLGGSLRIPLQQQAPAVQDPGPPAAQAPAVAQAQVAPAAAPAARPAAARPAARPAAAPAAAPIAAPAPGGVVPATPPILPPAAATPVPGQPAEPGDPVVKGRPNK